MPSESCERKAMKVNPLVAPPSEQEPLQCPRCESKNTKFCYYNNYNFSQPRHFCKACRRYWTQGGALRDIPVGGGTRKNAKRSRTLGSSCGVVTPTSSSSSPAYEYRHTTTPSPATTTTATLLAPLSADHHGGSSFPLMSAEATKLGASVCGGFTSLLNTHGPAIFSLGGFGLGLGSGVDDLGFGLGRSVWPFPGIAVADGGATGVGGGPSHHFIGNGWQLQSGGGDSAGVVGGGDCFTLSDIALARTGHALN